MPDFKSLLLQEFSHYGELSSEQTSRLQAHYELMVRWNRRMNLTRITDLLLAVQLHYCESLYAAAKLAELPKDVAKIGDIGSGAGFPGIPMAIYRPDLEFALIESDQRKAVFLREASRELRNVRVIAERAETVTERFDLVVSRAVRPEEVLALKISDRFMILGSEGEPMPWGEKRALLRTGW